MLPIRTDGVKPINSPPRHRALNSIRIQEGQPVPRFRGDESVSHLKNLLLTLNFRLYTCSWFTARARRLSFSRQDEKDGVDAVNFGP